jgi:dTDP-4-dehydrorhamnose reductase
VKILFTGGSSLLAINWACLLRSHHEISLAAHRHIIRLKGTKTIALNLEDLSVLKAQLHNIRPDLIVHTVALTNVDACEQNPVIAHHVNAELALCVARAAAEENIRLIHLSTDHLFDGSLPFRKEEDAPCPLNVYGKTKILAEKWVLEAHTNALVLRTNFFGWGHPRRESFSDWIIQTLRSGGRLPMFEEISFTPLLADRLALAAHGLVERDQKGIFNIVGNERISKFDFAVRIARRFGLPLNLIDRVHFSDRKPATVRPKDLSLDNGKAAALIGNFVGSIDDDIEQLYQQEKEGRAEELREALEE